MWEKLKVAKKMGLANVAIWTQEPNISTRDGRCFLGNLKKTFTLKKYRSMHLLHFSVLYRTMNLVVVQVAEL